MDILLFLQFYLFMELQEVKTVTNLEGEAGSTSRQEQAAMIT
jgi:hypothetical protein